MRVMQFLNNQVFLMQSAISCLSFSSIHWMYSSYRETNAFTTLVVYLLQAPALSSKFPLTIIVFTIFSNNMEEDHQLMHHFHLTRSFLSFPKHFMAVNPLCYNTKTLSCHAALALEFSIIYPVGTILFHPDIVFTHLHV